MLTQARLLMIAPLLSALLSAVLWILLPIGSARAALHDPTRPPAGLGTSPTPTPTTSVPPADTVARTPVARSAPPVVLPIPRVQALHLPADTLAGRATALIDGRLVRVGDRLGDATVQDIRADGVWMRLARGGTQWLGLYTLAEIPASESKLP